MEKGKEARLRNQYSLDEYGEDESAYVVVAVWARDRVQRWKGESEKIRQFPFSQIGFKAVKLGRSEQIAFHSCRSNRSGLIKWVGRLTSCGASSACCLQNENEGKGQLFHETYTRLMSSCVGERLTVDSVTDQKETTNSMKERSSRSVRTIKVTSLVSRERVQSCLLSGCWSLGKLPQHAQTSLHQYRFEWVGRETE